MLHHHAITYNDRLSLADLDYLVKKANKLGHKGTEVVRVHEEADAEGVHVYFDITGGKNEQRRTESEIREEC
jgi:hypothetical protein